MTNMIFELSKEIRRPMWTGCDFSGGRSSLGVVIPEHLLQVALKLQTAGEWCVLRWRKKENKDTCGEELKFSHLDKMNVKGSKYPQKSGMMDGLRPKVKPRGCWDSIVWAGRCSVLIKALLVGLILYAREL